MRRACRRVARMRARVVVPTRKGPSMTMKRGGCGLRCGRRARLVAEESLPGIFSCDPGQAGINRRIIAESRREFCLRHGAGRAIPQGQKCKNIFTFMA